MGRRRNGIVTLSSEVLFQEVADEAVLLDLKGERYFGLDPVGTRIWQLLQAQAGLEQVRSALLAEYDVDPEQLDADLDRLLGQLEEAGLVQIKSGTDHGPAAR